MKKTYIAPQMELIKLDNEISLALESNPPAGPGEIVSNISLSRSQDAFKTNS